MTNGDAMQMMKTMLMTTMVMIHQMPIVMTTMLRMVSEMLMEWKTNPNPNRRYSWSRRLTLTLTLTLTLIGDTHGVED